MCKSPTDFYIGVNQHVKLKGKGCQAFYPQDCGGYLWQISRGLIGKEKCDIVDLTIGICHVKVIVHCLSLNRHSLIEGHTRRVL